MPQLGNDRFWPHIHAAEYVGSFIYKDVFCSCRIGQHLFTASDIFFSWDKRISQQMYMDIQVKISLQAHHTECGNCCLRPADEAQ